MNRSNLKLFVCLVFLNFLSYSTYGIPITYFPKVASDRGLHSYITGIIFSMYPLFAFVFSFVVGKMLKMWNKKWILKSSQILLGCATLLFGFSYMFPYMTLFVSFSMLGRALQGMSIGAYQTAAYAYIPEYWPQEVDQRICIMEISVAFGIGMGPIISSVIYETIGYIWIYIVPSIMIVLTGTVVATIVLPAQDHLASENLGEGGRSETLSVCKCLFNKEMIYTFLSVVVTFTSFTLIMPMFELKILDMQEGPEIASVIFAFVQVGYGVGCGVLLVCKVENRKGLFFIGLFFNMIGLWLLGGDTFIHVDRVYILILMATGLFIVGLTSSLTMIPNFSQNFYILRKLYPEAHEDLLVAMSSGFFTAAIALAEFQGPIIGGILGDFFGFSKGCLFFSMGVLVFFLLFTFHAKGYEDFGKMLVPDALASNLSLEPETNSESKFPQGECAKAKEKEEDLTSLNSEEEEHAPINMA